MAPTDPSGRFGLSEGAAVAALASGLSALDMYGAVRILQPQGREGLEAAGMILQMLKTGGMALLSFLPVFRTGIIMYESMVSASEVARTVYHLFTAVRKVYEENKDKTVEEKLMLVVVYTAGALLKDDDMDQSDDGDDGDGDAEDGDGGDGGGDPEPAAARAGATGGTMARASTGVGRTARGRSPYNWLFDAVYTQILSLSRPDTENVLDANDYMNSKDGRSSANGDGEPRHIWPSVNECKKAFKSIIKELGLPPPTDGLSNRALDTVLAHLVKKEHIIKICGENRVNIGPGIIWHRGFEDRWNDAELVVKRRNPRMFEPTYLPESGGRRYLRATRLIKYHTKIYDQAARQRPKRRAVKRLGRVAEGWLNWVEANKQDILYHKDNVKEKPCHIVR